jgi:hypothetical protein
MCWTLNHQNIIEIAQRHISLSGITQSSTLTEDPPGSIAYALGCTTLGVYVGYSMVMDV